MSLLDQQLEFGLLYSKLDIYRKRLDFSLRGIEEMRKCAPRSYLSLSFGKQSICLAHMLFSIDQNTPMFFLASGESFLMHNFEEIINSFTSRWAINLTIVKQDHVFDGKNLSWQESRDAGKGDLEKMCNRTEWDGWYWGLSKEESKARFRTLSHRWDGQPHATIFRYTDGKFRCCPIMNWSLNDLAAYIASHNLPLLAQYHRHGLQTRTTARITRRAAEYGAVENIKQTDVTAFNRLCQRFPELRLRT